jgi:UDPglucose 6-dehydrogenase
MTKKILIIGWGYVGKAMVNFLKDNFDLNVYDPNLFSTEKMEEKEKFDKLYENTNVKKIENYENVHYDLAVICVPTPMAEDNSCDTGLVEKVIKIINAEVILIKSSVKPKTTDVLKIQTGKRIVFSPEYISESKYWSPYKFHTDMKETPFFIFGGDKEDCNICIDFWMRVCGPKKEYFKTTALNAELIKYFENTFYGLKVTLVNEFFEICEAMKADWYDVWHGWTLDPRMEKIIPLYSRISAGLEANAFQKTLMHLLEQAKMQDMRLNY